MRRLSVAEQPEAAGPPGHRGEQVCLDPHLRFEDDEPAAAGPQQQLHDRPAAGHGQVTDDVVTISRWITRQITWASAVTAALLECFGGGCQRPEV